MMIPNYIPLPDFIATEKLARQFAAFLQQGDFVALRGPLGAGKTTFARALLHELGIADDVPSPTFTLLQTYETPRFLISHFDLYRLKSARELDELGWDDAIADGLTLVEWPERAENRLPEDHLVLHFTFDANGQRVCLVEPYGVWTQRLKMHS